LKEKIEKLVERSVSLKLTQMKVARELGFDSSKEIYIKGEQTIVIIQEISNEHSLIITFEMNALKTEFFDCEAFITTIDDLIVSLLEGASYDKVALNPDSNSLDKGIHDGN